MPHAERDRFDLCGALRPASPRFAPFLRKLRFLRRIFDPRPLASFHYTLTFHSCAAPHAGPPQSRLAPAPEPLPSCASLRTGKLDSCRFLSTPVDSSPHARGPSRTRPRSHSAPLACPRRAEPPQCRVDGNRRESTGIGSRGKKPHPTNDDTWRARNYCVMALQQDRLGDFLPP